MQKIILHNVIQFIPFVTYPLFTFLLPCFWLGNRPRKFQSWYTCNYHISSLSLDIFHFWLSPFGIYMPMHVHSMNLLNCMQKTCLPVYKKKKVCIGSFVWQHGLHAYKNKIHKNTCTMYPVTIVIIIFQSLIMI